MYKMRIEGKAKDSRTIAGITVQINSSVAIPTWLKVGSLLDITKKESPAVSTRILPTVAQANKWKLSSIFITNEDLSWKNPWLISEIIDFIY